MSNYYILDEGNDLMGVLYAGRKSLKGRIDGMVSHYLCSEAMKRFVEADEIDTDVRAILRRNPKADITDKYFEMAKRFKSEASNILNCVIASDSKMEEC